MSIADMLHLGDCLSFMRAMPDNSVDLGLTDPPYESHMHLAKAGEKARQMRTDGHAELRPVDFTHVGDIRQIVAGELTRICRGWVLVFCTPEGIAPWRDAFEAAGARYKRACFWVKPDSAPQFNGQGPAFAVEAFVAVWCGAGKSRWNGGGRRNWWLCPTNGPWRDGRHPTEKPHVLMADLVTHFSAPDDLVFDPFAGSGSTGVGALAAGRRFLGCENLSHWHEVAIERLSATVQRERQSPRLELMGGAHGL